VSAPETCAPVHNPQQQFKALTNPLWEKLQILLEEGSRNLYERGRVLNQLNEIYAEHGVGTKEETQKATGSAGSGEATRDTRFAAVSQRWILRQPRPIDGLTAIVRSKDSRHWEREGSALMSLSRPGFSPSVYSLVRSRHGYLISQLRVETARRAK
jgi:hypothetical protein